MTGPLTQASPHLLANLDQLAAIPEEEVWLASQKSARTRRAYKLDVAHFMRKCWSAIYSHSRQPAYA